MSQLLITSTKRALRELLRIYKRDVPRPRIPNELERFFTFILSHRHDDNICAIETRFTGWAKDWIVETGAERGVLRRTIIHEMAEQAEPCQFSVTCRQCGAVGRASGGTAKYAAETLFEIGWSVKDPNVIICDKHAEEAITNADDSE